MALSAVGTTCLWVVTTGVCEAPVGASCAMNEYVSPQFGLRPRYGNDSINISRLRRFGLGSNGAAKPMSFTSARELVEELLRSATGPIPSTVEDVNAYRVPPPSRPT